MTARNSEPNARAPTPRVSSRQPERLVAKFERMLKRSGDVAVERFGEEAAAGMRQEMKAIPRTRADTPRVPCEASSSPTSRSSWQLVQT